jgi:hypothetical protein
MDLKLNWSSVKGTAHNTVLASGGATVRFESPWLSIYFITCDRAKVFMPRPNASTHVMRDFTDTTAPTMKLTDLIPYLKHADQWDDLLADLRIDTNCEEVLIYALDKLDIDSDIL